MTFWHYTLHCNHWNALDLFCLTYYNFVHKQYVAKFSNDVKRYCFHSVLCNICFSFAQGNPIERQVNYNSVLTDVSTIVSLDKIHVRPHPKQTDEVSREY